MMMTRRQRRRRRRRSYAIEAGDVAGSWRIGRLALLDVSAIEYWPTVPDGRQLVGAERRALRGSKRVRGAEDAIDGGLPGRLLAKKSCGG